MNRISDLMRDPTELPTLCYHVSVDTRRSLGLTWPCWYNYLVPSVSKTVSNIFLLFINQQSVGFCYSNPHEVRHSIFENLDIEKTCAPAKLRKGQQGWIIDKGECQKMKGKELSRGFSCRALRPFRAWVFILKSEGEPLKSFNHSSDITWMNVLRDYSGLQWKQQM